MDVSSVAAFIASLFSDKPSSPKDQPLNLRFEVEIDGLLCGGFTEVTGLSMEIETEDYHEGGVNDTVHALPKAVKYQNIALKKGLIHSDWMWKWIKDVAKGKIRKKDGRIILNNAKGKAVCTWNFEDAFPVKWTGTDLKATGGEVFIETLELKHGGIEKE